MKHYYLPFEPKADINYLHLFDLMEQAEYNKETKAFDTIRYVSVKKLADKLSFSKSTLDRIIDNSEYKPFFFVDRANKTITINNSFVGAQSKGKKFVMLTEDEVKLLREQKKNLLCKYLIYIKYYCGFSGNNSTDFTANQFLLACGYSIKSQEIKDTLSSYNKLLVNRGIIEIQRFLDDGMRRNIYKMKL